MRAATVAGPAATSAGAGSCPSLSRTLQRTSEGADVRSLQQYLVSGGYLTAEPTGYFGTLTEKALQDFQTKVGLVSSGSPASTGWGVLGPKTRAAIAQRCGGTTATSPTTSVVASACATAPAFPAELCVGTWQKLMSATSCHVGWQCVPFTTSTGNKPPVIAGIDGPTSLNAGAVGSWTVRATDPEGGALKYSVIWGDEVAGSILSVLAGVSNATFSSVSKLSHSYAVPGKYSFAVTVQDSAGATAHGRVAVQALARSEPTFSVTDFTQTTTEGSCTFAGQAYAEGIETEGYTIGDLCLATNGVCQNRGAYIPKFRCTNGNWQEVQTNPYPTMASYAGLVGGKCGATGSTVRGATVETVVSPGTLVCRGLLCATTQNFAPVTLTCEYEIWVDWGVFKAGATTTTVCASVTPCEYSFGTGGRACAPKQNGVCPVPSAGM
jgi:hypothetical protein